MSLEKAVYSKLSTNAGIIALASDRVYPLVMPDNPVFPCITYQRISTIRPQVLSGDPVTLANCLLQVDSWARKTADQGAVTASTLAKTVYTTLEGFRGIVAGVDIRGMQQLNESSGYEEDVGILRVTQTFRIFFIDS